MKNYIVSKSVTLWRDGNFENGFTMVELLVVMLVILILMAIAVPTYLGITNNARNTIPATDLAEAIIAASAVYSSDTGAFANLNTATGLGQLQSTEPGVDFTSVPLVSGMANSQYEIQVDACNLSQNQTCQWVAMAAFQPVVGSCYYILINKGNSAPSAINWDNPSSVPPISAGKLGTGTWYATIGPNSPNYSKRMVSCNVFTDKPRDVQASGFPLA